MTTDILPTLCALVDQPVPERPMDGINLEALLYGTMTERGRPVFFWQFNAYRERQRGFEPYLPAALQQGTTPTRKLRNGSGTRTFLNFHHRTITAEDFTGPRAILHQGYKLVVAGQKKDELQRELFDLRDDPAEKNNLIEAQPAVAQDLAHRLRMWQESTLQSLTGEDYRPRS